MSENQQQEPDEEVGGYGTPTAEQEAGGQRFAQPREEEDFDAAGLSQDMPDGERYPTAAPNLSHMDPEERDSSGEPGAGRFGGTDDQSHAEMETDEPGFEPVPQESAADEATGRQGFGDEGVEAGEPEDSGEDVEDEDVIRPSSDAEMDEGNTEERPPGVPFTSEPSEETAE